VLRLNWRELLFGEAEGIMPQHEAVISAKFFFSRCAEIGKEPQHRATRNCLNSAISQNNYQLGQS
jgi:hypothetical protein